MPHEKGVETHNHKIKRLPACSQPSSPTAVTYLCVFPLFFEALHVHNKAFLLCNQPGQIHREAVGVVEQPGSITFREQAEKSPCLFRETLLSPWLCATAGQQMGLVNTNKKLLAASLQGTEIALPRAPPRSEQVNTGQRREGWPGSEQRSFDSSSAPIPPSTISQFPAQLSPWSQMINAFWCIQTSHSLTRNGFAVAQALDLPVQDTTSSAERFQELILFFIDNVLHHIWVLLQLRKGISLQTQKDSARRSAHLSR